MREAPFLLAYSRLSSAYQHFYPQLLCTVSGDLLINPITPLPDSVKSLVKNHTNRQTPHKKRVPAPYPAFSNSVIHSVRG